MPKLQHNVKTLMCNIRHKEMSMGIQKREKIFPFEGLGKSSGTGLEKWVGF